MVNLRHSSYSFNNYNCTLKRFPQIFNFLLHIALTFKTVQSVIFVGKDQSINTNLFSYSNESIQINSSNYNLSNQDENSRQSLIINDQPERLKRESTEQTFCGDLQLLSPDIPKVPIREGQKIPDLEFEKIHNKFTFGSVFVNNQCKIEICGTVPYVNLGVCKDFWTSESPITNPYFHSLALILTSVSCGCEKNRPNCGNETCSRKPMDELIRINPKMCGVLFEETNCQDCYHDGILLENNIKFETRHALSIKSFVLRPGCKMERTTFTSAFSSVPSTIPYFESESSLTVTYTRKGEFFICDCYFLSPLQNLEDPTTLRSTQEPATNRTTETTTLGTTAQTTLGTTAQTTLVTTAQTTLGTTEATTFRTTKQTTLRATVQATTLPITEPTILPTKELAKTHPTVEQAKTLQNAEEAKILQNAEQAKTLPTTEQAHVKSITAVSTSTLVKEEKVESSGSLMIILLSGLGALFGLVLGGIITLIIAMYFFKRHRPQQHHQIVLTKEEIRHFKEGLKNSSRATEVSNLGSGQSQAFVLPYDVKFELNKNEIRFNPGDPKTIIGEGAYGIVYKGMFVSLDVNRFQDVAIKTLRPRWQPKDGTVKALLNEIKVLSYIGYHPNIVYFIGACTDNLEKGEVFLVLKLCHGGSLKNYLKEERDVLERNNKEISDKLFNLLVKWSAEIASGMEFLTTKNVVHIDLAARNVLLTDDLIAVISDFGLSRKLYDKIDYEKEGKEPIPIKGVALESLATKTYSKKSDVWGYGVTMWEIFSLGEDPYEQMSTMEIFSTLANGRRLPRPKYSSLEIYQEMLKCWNPDPDARPSFSELRNFFKNI